MTIVRIYAPVPSAMQSGRFRPKKWRAVFDTVAGKTFTDPLMGWCGGNDTRKQIRLNFNTEQDAVAYAEKRGFTYCVVLPQLPRVRPKSYADNFSS